MQSRDNDNQKQDFAQLRKGLLEVAVLTIVSAHEVYAADILERLGQTEFGTAEGTLYPLLSKMKREGLLDYSWVESPNGPPRKYYSLTETGMDRLKAARQYLALLNDTLNDLGGNHA